jgi:hypothetical protein
MQCSPVLFIQSGLLLISDSKLGFPFVSQHIRKPDVSGFAFYGRRIKELVTKEVKLGRQQRLLSLVYILSPKVKVFRRRRYSTMA